MSADDKDAEIARLKALIDRDRTGLANALNNVRQVILSYGWIPAGEWGSYEWDERTEEHFREEIGRCFFEAERIAVQALRDSGSLANEAFRLEDAKANEVREKDRRVYYQNIVYAVCRELDRAFSKRITHGEGTVCGTVEHPSTEVQDLMRELVAEYWRRRKV